MATRLSRVRLLHGALKDEPIRPPWAVDESLFVNQCDRCDKCIQACEYQTLIRGPGGFPIVDFSQSGCDFCGDCVRACSHDVLKFPADPHQPPWSVKAEILSQCISLHGTLCRTCGEACEENAIRFKLEVGGIARPLLDTEKCSGCGECYAVCPIKSIRFNPLSLNEEVA